VTDIISWLASNMDLWRNIAILALAGFAVGVLYIAYGTWED